ncbi:MAG: histidine kinase dimerization/phospho-acceptor domain-containing protein [Novosphingobium sp.]
MLYDDRLGTVLRHRPGGPAAAKTQFRQLLDLLGTLPSEARGAAVDAAYLRLAEHGLAIKSEDKLAMLADPGLRLRSPRLLALLANDEPQVAAAAIRQGRLADQEWLDLIPALPIPARHFLRQRGDLGDDVRALLDALGVHDRALPPAAGLPSADEAAAALTPEPSVATQGIAALVKRIEAFRKTRQPEAANDRAHPRGDGAPRLPLGEEFAPRAPRELRAFDFACDPEGRVTWADPGVAPMIVGLDLVAAAAATDDGNAAVLAQAIRRHQPLRAVRLHLSGAPQISGGWQIDAAPWFDPIGGRLAGWRGRFRRPPPAAGEPHAPTSGEADRIRQLLHELRTPVNAIQGYAEAMQQALFGPIGHEYRAMSAAIASDAARILAGFEELERLARLDGGAMKLEPGECDLGEVVAATISRLRPHTSARQGGFDFQAEARAPIALAPVEVERLVWRLLATLAAAAAPGEILRLRLRSRQGQVRLKLQLPAALADRSDEDLFRASATNAVSILSAGNFGGGFALRLAAAEARSAGGSLLRRGDKLRLTLLGLTAPVTPHSDGADNAGSQTAGSN